jgi:hypothetical protein
MLSTRLTAWLLAIAVPLVLLFAYIGGYFFLAIEHRSNQGGSRPSITRWYRPWLKDIYLPAGKVDQLITGRRVYIRWATDDDFEDDSGRRP